MSMHFHPVFQCELSYLLSIDASLSSIIAHCIFFPFPSYHIGFLCLPRTRQTCIIIFWEEGIGLPGTWLPCKVRTLTSTQVEGAINKLLIFSQCLRQERIPSLIKKFLPLLSCQSLIKIWCHSLLKCEIESLFTVLEHNTQNIPVFKIFCNSFLSFFPSRVFFILLHLFVQLLFLQTAEIIENSLFSN